MHTISRELPNQFEYSENKIQYALRNVVLPQDFPLLFKWMHEPHVIPQWQLNKPELELAVYFERMLCDDHQRLFIIQIEGEDVGYLELYEAKRDRLALYYEAWEDDVGWHVLLGEPQVVGKGHFRAVMRMLSFFVFEHTQARRIVGEPDKSMVVYTIISDDIAYYPQQEIKLLEKTAILYHCFRDKFYSHCGSFWQNRFEQTVLIGE